MTVQVPGGWCLSPWENASGLTAWWLLYGSDQFRDWLGGVLTEALGGSQATQNLVQDALNRAWDANAPILDQQVTEWGEVIYATWAPTAVLVENLRDTSQIAAQALQRLATYVKDPNNVPTTAMLQEVLNQAVLEARTDAAAALAEAEASAQAGDDVLNSYAEQLYNEATAQVQAAEAQATAEVQAALDTAIAKATTDSQLVEQWVQQIVAEVNIDLTDLINQVNASLQALEGYVTAGVTQAENYAQTATTQGIENLQAGNNQQLVTTLSPGWAGTAESMNQATEQLVADDPNQTQNVSLVPTTVPPDAVGAIAALATGVRTLALTATECALPNCNVKNKAASQLKDLLGLATDGALLAFLVYCVKEPTQAADDGKRIVTSVGETIVTAARDAFGLGS